MPYQNLEKLSKSIGQCTACPLHIGRKIAVPGEGNEQAAIVFIGEGPGQREDESGRPFVGAAGQLLEQLLATIKIKREDVFITNVVKCRPPNNRDPEPEEADVCTKLYLEEQLKLLKPKLIVTLGRHAMGYFLPETFRISAVHGKPYRRHGRIILPFYHPAAALYNRGLQSDLERDFSRIPALLKKIAAQA